MPRRKDEGSGGPPVDKPEKTGDSSEPEAGATGVAADAMLVKQAEGLDPDMVRVQNIMTERRVGFSEAASIFAEEQRRKLEADEEAKAPPKFLTTAQLIDLAGDDMHAPPEAVHNRVIAALKVLGIYTVRLQERHAEWLTRMAQFEAMERRAVGKYHVENFLELVVREGFAADPTKAGKVIGVSSGRAVDFNVGQGDWTG